MAQAWRTRFYVGDPKYPPRLGTVLLRKYSNDRRSWTSSESEVWRVLVARAFINGLERESQHIHHMYDLYSCIADIAVVFRRT